MISVPWSGNDIIAEIRIGQFPAVANPTSHRPAVPQDQPLISVPSNSTPVSGSDCRQTFNIPKQILFYCSKVFEAAAPYGSLRPNAPHDREERIPCIDRVLGFGVQHDSSVKMKAGREEGIERHDELCM